MGKRVVIVVMGAVLLSGCWIPEKMPRQEVITAVKECEAAGMKPVLMGNWNDTIVDVQCRIDTTQHPEGGDGR